MNSKTIIEKFEHLHAKFAEKITNSLSHWYSHAEREDATEEAFLKVMTSTVSDDACMTLTDDEWYAKIRSLARGCLSNAIAKGKTRAKYARLAAAEPKVVPWYTDPRKALNMKLTSQALARTLELFRKDYHISNKNMDIYLRLLDGEAGAAVAKDYGITANHAFQIKFRIGKLLQNRGRRYFAQALREI